MKFLRPITCLQQEILEPGDKKTQIPKKVIQVKVLWS